MLKQMSLRLFSSLTILTALAAGVYPFSAQAVMIPLFATMTGSQEVPPVNTPATGTAVMTLDTDTNLFAWDVIFQNLVADSILAHFHGPAPIGQTAPPQIDLFVASTTAPPLGARSGEFLGSQTLTDTQEQQVLSGLWYVNVHSVTYPAGEIRGQVFIPEPSSLSLAALGLAGAYGWRRRRTEA